MVGELLADRYDVVRLIARGGMGEVYEAHDAVLGRSVAVKVYRSEIVADRSRFDAEVRILAALSHPGLVQVYDAGEHDDDEFVVLELVDGPTLAALLRDRGALPAQDVRGLGLAVGAALGYVHEAGVVHRDVTPSNILCGNDGRARLADFGIARLLDTTRLTAINTTIGTAAYMAPEQVMGDEVTASADIYALALILLEALTGRTAFGGAGHEVALARLARDPDVVTDVPLEWQPLLRSMTARAPEDRPMASGVVDRLGQLEVGVASGPSAASMSVTERAASVATTQVVPVAAIAPSGGTAVMPASSRAASPEPIRSIVGARRGRSWLWAAVGFVALVAAAMIADRPTTIAVPPSSTQVVVTAPPPVPTTVPATTTEPPKEEKGKGKDRDD